MKIGNPRNAEGHSLQTPIGVIMAWVGGYFTDANNAGYNHILPATNDVAGANTYLAKYGWRVCDGGIPDDPLSPIWNNGSRYVPNLTDDRFIMGDTAVGAGGGSNVLLDHTHSSSLNAAGQIYSNSVYASAHNHTAGTGTATPGTDGVGLGHQHYIAGHQHTGTSGSAGVSHSGNASYVGYANVDHTHGFSTDTYANHVHGITHLRTGTGTVGYLAGSGTSVEAPTETAGAGSHSHSGTTGGTSVGHIHEVNIAHDHGSHTHSIPSQELSTDSKLGSHSHTVNSHNHAIENGTAPTVDLSHSHSASSVSGTVGTGNVPSSTDNVPEYLNVFYIIKIK
jgi:hypothetical protein